MTLLQEIKRDATDDKVNLTVVLRKCKILAAELGNEKLAEWVGNEQNGYSDVEHCPNYRKLKTHSFGTLFNDGNMTKNIPIPPSSLPEKLREFCTTDYLMKSIAFYEHMLADKEIQKVGLKIPWHGDAIAMTAIHYKKTNNPILVEAWKALSLSTMSGLLEIVRNKVLDFVLEIQKKFPDVGEPSFDKDSLNGNTLDKIVQNFFGETFVVNDGGTVNIQIVKKGNFASLGRFLKSEGITDAGIKALDAAIKEERPKSRKALGGRITAWLQKNVEAVAITAGGAAAQTGGTKVMEAVLRFLGF